MALSDFLNIVQTDIDNHQFEELWTLTFRAVDDIKVCIHISLFLHQVCVSYIMTWEP